MKKILFTLFICVLYFSSFSQWTTQTSGTSSPLTSVYFTDANNGYAASAMNEIFRTTNAGATWALQYTGGSSLYSIFFSNVNQGTAVGAGGSVVNTTDAGNTWSSTSSGQGNALNSVFYVDADTGYAVGNNGTILKTTNAGITWSPKTSGTINSLTGVFFTDPDIGYAVGSSIVLKTTDQGNTWIQQASGYNLMSVYFTDANTGYTTAANGSILKTTNAGATWTSLSSGTANPLYSIHFGDFNNGFAVGDLGTIVKTNDAGTTWFPQTSGTSNTLYSIFFTDLNNGFTVDGNGGIYNTIDGGCATPTVTISGTDTICNGSSTTLTASGASTYLWNTADITYTVSVSPTSNTTYTVIGTSADGCTNSETVTVTVDPIPSVNAGADQTVCANSSTVSLSGASSNTGVWTTSGTGTFLPNSTTLNATYNPSAGDIIAGSVPITLSSTNNGACSAVNDVMVVTINPSPVVSAGINQSICDNIPVDTLNGSSSTGSGIWTTSGTGTFQNNTTLIAIYNPSPADIFSGLVSLVLTSSSNGVCMAEADTLFVSFTPMPIATLGADTMVCTGNPALLLNGVSSTGTGTWTSSGTGTFTPNNATLNATYSPSAIDISGGLISLLLTTTSNGVCSSDEDTMLVYINPSPSANASATPSVTCLSNPVNFTDASTISGGTITNWFWQFGDGGTGTTTNPSHGYALGGNYLVTLIVNSNLNCKDTAYLNVVLKSDTLSGFITDTNNVAVTSGVVYVFTRNIINAGLLDTMGFTNITAGNYAFPCLDTGNYIIKAIADTLAYPTSVGKYYSSIPNAYQWDSAQVVSITSAGVNVSGKNIKIIQMPIITGPGIVSGQVTEGAGFGQRFGGGTQILGAPLKGVDVKLGKNPGGSPAARTTTDGGGNYTFTNIPLGSYKIYIDIPNFGMDSVLDVVLTSTNTTSAQNNYYVDSLFVRVDTVVTVGVIQTAVGSKQLIVYPNPSNGIVTLKSESEIGPVSIYNSLGEIVFKEKINSKQHQIDLRKQAVGIYFLQTQSGNIKILKE